MASLLTKAKQAVLLKLDAHGTAQSISTFQKTGKLTPEEFVKAGDYIVENYPSWSWGSGLPEKVRPHLPADKQFLQTRDVPCFSRDRKSANVEEMQVEEDDGDGGWVQTSMQEDDPVEDLDAGISDLSVKDTASSAAEAANDDGDAAAEDEDEDIDDIPDLDDFDYSALEEENDPAAAAASAAAEDTLVPTRTYDITITYDVYYSTPRVWLFGYDKDHNPLKDNEWRDDFSAEHVDKTVTHEQHPHFNFSCPSIHPCKHAQAMTKMISLVVGAGNGSLDVSYYMLIFLKFIQSIIPNIEYDYTGDFQIKEASE